MNSSDMTSSDMNSGDQVTDGNDDEITDATPRGASIDVEFVKPLVLHALRRQVLRPGQPWSSVDHDYDSWPETFHVAAFGPRGEVAACASFHPDAAPHRSDADPKTSWRLRAMASLPELRGQGYGAAALRYGIAEVRRRGGALLWCNARSGAVGFYERLGFSIIGDEFEIAPIGPHYVMEIEL
jgi:GNAT superfamily N-acetyltransferase